MEELRGIVRQVVGRAFQPDRLVDVGSRSSLGVLLGVLVRSMRRVDRGLLFRLWTAWKGRPTG